MASHSNIRFSNLLFFLLLSFLSCNDFEFIPDNENDPLNVNDDTSLSNEYKSGIENISYIYRYDNNLRSYVIEFSFRTDLYYNTIYLQEINDENYINHDSLINENPNYRNDLDYQDIRFRFNDLKLITKKNEFRILKVLEINGENYFDSEYITINLDLSDLTISTIFDYSTHQYLINEAQHYFYAFELGSYYGSSSSSSLSYLLQTNLDLFELRLNNSNANLLDYTNWFFRIDVPDEPQSLASNFEFILYNKHLNEPIDTLLIENLDYHIPHDLDIALIDKNEKIVRIDFKSPVSVNIDSVKIEMLELFLFTSGIYENPDNIQIHTFDINAGYIDIDLNDKTVSFKYFLQFYRGGVKLSTFNSYENLIELDGSMLY